MTHPAVLENPMTTTEPSDTHALGQDRSQWRRVKFGDMAECVTDRVDNPAESGVDCYVGLEHLDPESLRIRRWGAPTDVESTKLRFQPGDIIFGKRRAYQRKLAVADCEGICSAHAMVLRAREDVVDKSFLPVFMQSDVFFERALSISVGSLSPTINWKTLAVQEFDLPPLEEQRRIAEVLWAVEVAVNNTEDVVAQSSDLYTAYIEQHFTDMGELEQGLSVLGDYCTAQVGFPFKSSRYVPQGVRLLRCSNVAIESLVWSPESTVFWPDNDQDQYQDYVLNEGDIIIAMDRPFIKEGFKIARVTKSDLPALLLQRVTRLNLGKRVLPEYVWAFLHTRRFQQHLVKEQRGTDLPHISKFDIEGAPFLAPDIAEQEKVVRAMEGCRLAISSASEHMAYLQVLRLLLRTRLLGGDKHV